MIGLVEADIVRAIVLCVCIFIVGVNLGLLVRIRSLTIVVPAWPLRLMLAGLSCFLLALIYVLARLLGSPQGEPISWLSWFAILGLVFMLAGLVWIYLDSEAGVIHEEEDV